MGRPLKFRLSNMMMGLSLGVAAVVVAAFGTGAWLYSRQRFTSELESARASARAQTETIRVALEHQMVNRDSRLIEKMVANFAGDPSVNNVMIVDKEGILKFSSRPASVGTEIRRDSPTCMTCHDRPPQERATSRVIETRGGEILRTVTPILNRKECHACHSPDARINGVLIVDIEAGRIRANLNRDLRRMVLGSGILALIVMAGIALIIRLVVLRRLRIFEDAARRIAAGDLERRLPVKGNDTLSWLARRFNSMADSVTTLLADVRRKGEQLETVINSVDDGIVVLDRRMKIVAANEAFVKRLGKRRDEVLGEACVEASSGLCNTAECPSRECFREGIPRTRVFTREGVQAGDTRFEEVHVSPIRDKTGDVRYVTEVWRDITQRRASEARMADSHRMASLGMLASGFSHELNTPLATVLTCLEGILRTEAESEVVDRDYITDSARIAREQVLRCRAITQQFLQMARGGASGDDLVDLAVVVPSMVRLVSPTARERDVRVEAVSCEGQVMIRANESEVQQVLLNLLMNAVQACGPGGRVTACLERGDGTTVTVSDDGCGMDEAQRGRVFEPFVSMRPGGTGLGLFISLELARKWGGSIRVESVLGQGSSFSVDFPVRDGTYEGV
ncbi:MAG: PAS domain S-box protein [Deltaproteobacteria bacterium]|nr:PAS domain S-box protein [Deltaproteobacteria bacterium]